MNISHDRLFRFAALFTWIAVGIPLYKFIWVNLALGEPFVTGDYLWAGGHLLFGLAFGLLVSHGDARFDGLTVLAFAVMTASALLVSYASETGLGGILLMVVAALLAWHRFPTRLAVAWLVAQTMTLALIFAYVKGISVPDAFLYSATYISYEAFAYVLALVAVRESHALDELRQLNSELRATRELLAESSRINERVRIARELHDLLGHHLTALSLNLEVASHVTDGKARSHVDQAKSLARLLLGDVREVVSNMRSGDTLDLSSAVRALADGVPAPRIHFEAPDQLGVDDPNLAQVVVRCVQEIITNTVKHANARNLWITLKSTDRGIEISARDDGRGVNIVHMGNGLKGMTERISQYGGQLACESTRGRGFSVKAWVPMEAAA